jgi:hypothetical protein
MTEERRAMKSSLQKLFPQICFSWITSVRQFGRICSFIPIGKSNKFFISLEEEKLPKISSTKLFKNFVNNSSETTEKIIEIRNNNRANLQDFSISCSKNDFQ